MSTAQAIDYFEDANSIGFSPEYIYINKELEDKRNTLKELPASYTNNERSLIVRDSLKVILLEYRDNITNGIDNVTLNFDAVIDIVKFAEMLPVDIEAPDIAIDPDGDISIEWYKSPRCVFSISFRGDNLLFFAGLFGKKASEKIHDRIILGNTIDKVIINCIRKVLAA